MPELPEVETVRIGLSELLPGRAITHVEHDWPKSFPNAEADVQEFLIGAKILYVKRRAKVLIIELNTKYSLIVHLKMTGQLVFRSDDDKTRFGAGHPNNSLISELPDKSTRVVLYLEDEIASASESSARKQRSAEQPVQGVQSVSTGAADTAVDQERWRSFGPRPKAGQSGAKLFFNDQRKFGWMRLVPTTEIPNIDFFKKIGPEPLSSEFTSDKFASRLNLRPNSGIKAVLLDQTIIAGVGNIYADESLFAAKIHPETKVQDISMANLTKLFDELIAVLKLSIEKGGSSDRNYVDARGRRGSYLSFAQVFRKDGQPCPRCGTIIVKIRVAGRGTHICPVCQLKPKA